MEKKNNQLFFWCKGFTIFDNKHPLIVLDSDNFSEEFINISLLENEIPSKYYNKSIKYNRYLPRTIYEIKQDSIVFVQNDSIRIRH